MSSEQIAHLGCRPLLWPLVFLQKYLACRHLVNAEPKHEGVGMYRNETENVI